MDNDYRVQRIKEAKQSAKTLQDFSARVQDKKKTFEPSGSHEANMIGQAILGAVALVADCVADSMIAEAERD